MVLYCTDNSRKISRPDAGLGRYLGIISLLADSAVSDTLKDPFAETHDLVPQCIDDVLLPIYNQLLFT